MRQLRRRARRAALEAFLTEYRYTVQSRVIRSFGDTRTEALFYDKFVRQFQGIARPAKRKLEALNAVGRLEELAVPPSNRLEKLKGTLTDFYSIRINDQRRVIFKWVKGGPHEVRIVD
jgi:toxin HigB-1